MSRKHRTEEGQLSERVKIIQTKLYSGDDTAHRVKFVGILTFENKSRKPAGVHLALPVFVKISLPRNQLVCVSDMLI